MKYAGVLLVMIYDYAEKQVLYEKKVELLPFLDSFSLPQMNDRSNLCENEINYQRKGFFLKIKSRFTGENNDICVTELDVSVEGELNFRGWQSKNFKTDENYSDLRSITKDEKFFFFNQKSYLKQCGFTLDLKKSLANTAADTSKRVADVSDSKAVFDGDMLTSWDGQSLRFKTSSPRYEDWSSSSSTGDRCMGVVDYGRGVFPYKCNWEWNFAQGVAEVTGKDDVSRTETVAMNLAGGLMHPDKIKAGEDYIKIGNKVHLLYAVEMVYDKLNFMNGFVFKTAKKFADRKTGQVNLVFTSNKDKVVATNLLLIKVSFGGILFSTICLLAFSLSHAHIYVVKSVSLKFDSEWRHFLRKIDIFQIR